MKPEHPIIRLLAALLGISIAAYCGAVAYGIHLQADRDMNIRAEAMALGVGFWGLLMGGGCIWSMLRRDK